MLLLLTLLATSFAQQTNNCQAPYTTECLTRSAQLTVLGTVVSNTLTNSTASSYNATISISCVYSSFSFPPTRLVTPGTYLVTNFGYPKAICGVKGGSSDALINQTKVFYLFISDFTTSVPVLSVFDVCQGGSFPSNNTLQSISDVLFQATDNNRILNGQCTLPAPSSSVNGTGVNTGLDLPGSAGSVRAGVAIVLISMLALI